MKKFAFLILSLALAFGCQPTDEGGGDGGDAQPASSDATDDTSDDSAATTTEEDATKMVALKITSPLR